jgi:hypothetical protein
MSIHLSSNSKSSRSPSNFVQIPPSSSSPPPPPSLPPLLDAALITVVQQQQQQSSRTPPPGFDRNQFDPILINLAGAHPSLSSSPSPKLPKTGATSGGTNGIPPPLQPQPPLSLPPPSSTSNCPPQTQHHVPLLTAHSFLYNPVEPYIFPIAIPPGFPSTGPDFMRLFAPNMAAVAGNPANQQGTSFVQTSNASQGPVPNGRSTTQSNGTNTPPEQNGQNHHPSPPPQSSSRHHHHQQQQHQSQQHHQHQSHHRHRQYHQSDSIQFQQQNGFHLQQQRQSQTSYPQQQYLKPKACYTCGDLGHLAFACPEQYSSDSNYPHNNNRGKNNLSQSKEKRFLKKF